jgi:hypothetical protein
MVSDEELEQMLDSGQSEVFVSNVSGHSQPPSAGPPIALSPGDSSGPGPASRLELL